MFVINGIGGGVMAIRFWEIYEETKEQFRLKIVAGKAGMDTVVSWVHMLEDETIVTRFHGEELAITTGMKAGQPNWLLKLVQEMAKEECAGIIINTGMYLERIPEDVIAWCDEHKFPLLEMPWEISITSLIQDYCMRIIDQMQYEKKISHTFREVIQGRGNEAEYRQVLGQRYDTAGTFRLFCLNVKRTIEEETNLNQALFKLENLFGLWKGNKKINISYGLVRMEDSIALVLNNMEHKYFMELPDLILQSFKYFVQKHCFYLGIGPTIAGIEELPNGYKRARTAMKMAIGTNQVIVRFDEMGFYRILYSIEDSEILLSYSTEILGKLVSYDKLHHTSYIDTLRSYLKNDRSILRVAEDTFTHRNTANYRIQKIKQIIGCEFKSMDEVFLYQVAFYIRDMEKKV
jgi:hypothetical protein